MDTQNKNNLAEKVMEEIKSKKVTMRSHIYFVSGTVITIFGVFITLLAGTISVNLFSFHYRMMRPVGLSPFGTPLPWLFLMVGLISIWIGILLIKKYDLSYKKNFVLIVGIFIVAILAFGLIIDNLGFNERSRPQKALHGMYRQFPKGDWLSGKVLEISENKILLEIAEGEKKEILLTNETKKPPFPINIGDNIKIISKTEDGVITALGIGPEKNKRRMMSPPPSFKKPIEIK